MPLRIVHRSGRFACVAWRAFTALALVAGMPLRASAQTFTLANSPDMDAHVSFSTGASWIDFDGDGDLDLYVVTGFGTNRNNVLYRNDAGVFVRITGVPLVQDNSDTACSTWADFDDDGDLDVFVSNLQTGSGALYSGQGGGVYTLNAAAGLPAGLKGTGCAWGDYDNDGFVDLVVAALFGQGGITTPSRLFHNDGDGTMTEVTTGPIASTTDTHHHATWSDFDRDGDLDLFFATGPLGTTEPDRMYRNLLVETGTADFAPITTGLFATDARDSQTLQWIDVDDDGDLDMFAVNYNTLPNQLYRNDGGGVFAKITTGPLVTDGGASHGAAWGDFDDDGDLDVYVATDLGQSNRYYRNVGGCVFTAISSGAFVNAARSNYGAVAGDYDQDGDLDLFVPTARTEGPSLLYRNDLANGNHWVEIEARGVVSNRSAIGAKVEVVATIGGAPLRQLREIQAATGYGGQNALAAHFGLGDATSLDTLRIEWPSGAVDVFTGFAADTRYRIPEGATLDAWRPPSSSLRPRLRVAPTPFRERTWLEVVAPRAAVVRLAVFDVAGRERARLADGRLAAGIHRFGLDRASLGAPGVYLAKLRLGPDEVTARVVLVE